ncbi:hypothetical protein [Microbacterium sp. Bi128]|uniref:hypothetical protein n=1 Tax=Microbacterium sp. Bi128 TaxID=2821115 RepID=UPI001D2E8EAC|nr:hypothetical protein [Microbacterium sp. Bi128]CAH0163434.1 hypothetical protein SRABI128_00846 [Microbacterium sp. Bi128]
MRRGDPFRTYFVTVIVVAALSIGLGLLIGGLTGHYVTVFFVQLLVAGPLAAWYVSIKKRVVAQK